MFECILSRPPDHQIGFEDTFKVGMEFVERDVAAGPVCEVPQQVQLTLSVSQGAHLLLAERAEIPEVRTEHGHHLGGTG
jgi:hypothetical protein